MTEPLLSLREIELFVAAYEERSFTAAAKREHATQSGISQHIRHIEDCLKTALFDRRKGVEPTPAGTAYYNHFIEVLRLHARATATLKAYSAGAAGECVIGITPALAVCQVAPAFLRFCDEHPNATVRVIEAGRAVLLERLLLGDLDAAVVPAMDRWPEGMVGDQFADTPLFLVAARGGPVLHGHAMNLASLDRADLLPIAIEDRLDTLELGRMELKIDAVTGTLDLVRQGHWKAILPGLMLSNEFELLVDERDFSVHPLQGANATLSLALVQRHKRPLPAAAAAFISILSEVTQQHLAGLTERVPTDAAAHAGPTGAPPR